MKNRIEDGFIATDKAILEEHTTRQEYAQISRLANNVLSVNFKGIPDELQKIPQWIAWKYGPNNKRPIITPRTGRAASVTDPTTWGTFEEVMEKKLAGQYHGIGLVLTPDLGIVGIDIDHCVSASGAISRLAIDTLDMLDSYSELSPSGTGIHILVRGKKPGDRQRGSLEIYDSNRFLSMTGHRLAFVPNGIQDRQDELEYLYKEQFPQRTIAATPRTKYPPKTDSEVIEKLRTAKNAWKSWPLWEGRWKGQYPSQSEADRQLIMFLLYWTGNDVEQADRLFRRSGLMRSKWNEMRGSQTYGESTIQNALQARG